MGPVLVLGKSRKRGAEEAVEESKAKLDKMFGIAGIDMDGTLDLQSVDAAWAIVFGGDGAILDASRRMGDKTIPTLAVNFGRLGFLTEVEYEELDQALGRIQAGKYRIRERMRLTAHVGDWREHALNDVVVTAGVSGRLFRVSVKIERREAIRYAGDGVVIATPTGSTAYSLAAGGPILDPELKATVLTPLAAHTLSQTPIVIPTTHKIDLYLREGDPPGRVVVDGQSVCTIGQDDHLIVSESKTPFRLLKVTRRSYYSRLRRMLGWGGQPKYAK
ncbi:MAG: NAD(+)/NADH kinase [Planctomycetota bacterium]|jgi:NAD+ kinase